jgi:hypothetical protein
MKKLLFFISVVLILAGCSKSSPVKPIQLTGRYISYREVDTSYNGFNVADGIWNITVYFAAGDSVYNYPGTVHANSGYSNTPTNNAAAQGNDILTFTSNNTATETETSYEPIYISYNLEAGTFNDGQFNTRERIVVVDANTVELITNPKSINNQPNTSGFMAAIYFRKQ